MGRKRRNNPLNLPERVYARHGAFYYVHPDGKWERIGTDVAEARKRGILYSDPDSQFGTMAYWLDVFLVHCEERTGLDRKKGGLSPQTLKDYKKTVVYLKSYFGKMLAHQIKGHHVAEYLDMGMKANRGVRANREKATLSACFTWLRTKSESGITDNPCIGIRRNRETKRDRYVTHEEYKAVASIASRNIIALMNLIYLTLQRPEDIIEWTPANIIQKRESDGTVRKVIRNDQGKRLGNGGKVVDILVTPQIEAILESISPKPPVYLSGTSTFIRTRKDLPYTYSGLTAMLQRYTQKAGVPSFGFYDMKGKGATDMWRSGVPLEQIQILCGHESITTTEVYVKSRWVDTVEPNKGKLSA
ncbi:tyrosine-type recombinase/integrase [Advenella sp. EE-W14]|uniref:tyrosine-type recombinase/integrase n=1 Tax=Advenella sp. EE-W14 TaxID=2722705 RepID=UPI00145D9BAA|nr:tyrosine-type recombinase/integrase [Advenella sp. EE-W14]